ncbi:galactokinase [Nocardioides sp. zg-536]|uniref:Galactokinase n=1 Tax=Nocardioides faecalis TaxID=2803858 RepID=A0A938XYV8_9ACTN|nr:galactokinase family protein [Nocardioides faecalis]MBM9459017.1 galactokinase [Nocardioides faecalis]QVI57284.1 galactokinase [Nocardioides faecalis]
MTSATATAPGRVNLIGEHTDYNGGLCLPVAVPLSTTVTVGGREDDHVNIISDAAGTWTGTHADVASGQVPGWARYVAGVLHELTRAGHRLPGLDLSITSSLPLGGGLSSSAALECAVALAVTQLVATDDQDGADGSDWLDEARRRQIAELCRRAETQYVGAPTGGMDQLASMLAREEHALLIDFAEPANPRTRPVPLPLGEAGLELLVTDTGVRHALADGDGGYAQRRDECTRAAADPDSTDPVLRARSRHVHSENDRVRAAVAAIEARDWIRLGALLTASHHSLRDDFEVSCAELDAAVDAALAAGALGARLTGGGFGGCTVALTHEDRVDAVRDGIDAAYARAGYPPPVHHRVRPAAGARID